MDILEKRFAKANEFIGTTNISASSMLSKMKMRVANEGCITAKPAKKVAWNPFKIIGTVSGLACAALLIGVGLKSVLDYSMNQFEIGSGEIQNNNGNHNNPGTNPGNNPGTNPDNVNTGDNGNTGNNGNNNNNTDDKVEVEAINHGVLFKSRETDLDQLIYNLVYQETDTKVFYEVDGYNKAFAYEPDIHSIFTEIQSTSIYEIKVELDNIVNPNFETDFTNKVGRVIVVNFNANTINDDDTFGGWIQARMVIVTYDDVLLGYTTQPLSLSDNANNSVLYNEFLSCYFLLGNKIVKYYDEDACSFQLKMDDKDLNNISSEIVFWNLNGKDYTYNLSMIPNSYRKIDNKFTIQFNEKVENNSIVTSTGTITAKIGDVYLISSSINLSLTTITLDYDCVFKINGEINDDLIGLNVGDYIEFTYVKTNTSEFASVLTVNSVNIITEK